MQEQRVSAGLIVLIDEISNCRAMHASAMASGTTHPRCEIRIYCYNHILCMICQAILLPVAALPHHGMSRYCWLSGRPLKTTLQRIIVRPRTAARKPEWHSCQSRRIQSRLPNPFVPKAAVAVRGHDRKTTPTP